MYIFCRFMYTCTFWANITLQPPTVHFLTRPFQAIFRLLFDQFNLCIFVVLCKCPSFGIEKLKNIRLTLFKNCNKVPNVGIK